MFETISWSDDGVVMLDQRRLPEDEIYLTLRTPEEVAEAIRTMAIRGAPAIGVAAAMGLALGAVRLAAELEPGSGGEDAFRPSTREPAAGPSRPGPEGPSVLFRGRLEKVAGLLAATRPTAVNLFWALERMRRVLDSSLRAGERGNRVTTPGGASGTAPASLSAVAAALVAEAVRIKEEDVAACRSMGRLGAEMVPDGATILTHCNAGALATAGYGTALGVVRAAREAGKRVRVLADETRPFLQGARLTAWELTKDGIDTTVITDGMAGHFLRMGDITLVVVGADRVAANGDVANKIGTYQVAVLAKENGVPFYVAAPLSTVDLSIPDGSHIPIEERSAEEVTHFAGRRVAAAGASARNPAFDVTPHRFVTAIITERGVARPPYGEALASLAAGEDRDR